MGPEINGKSRNYLVLFLSVLLIMLLFLIGILLVKLERAYKTNQYFSEEEKVSSSESHDDMIERANENTETSSEESDNTGLFVNRITTARIINKSSITLSSLFNTEPDRENTFDGKTNASIAAQKMEDIIAQYYPDAEENAFTNNGSILTNPDFICDYPLLVSVEDINHYGYYVRLHYLYPYGDDNRTRINQGEESDIAVFVNGENSVRLNVPDGCYELWICFGEKWNGTESYFGEDTTWYTAQKPLVFYSDDKCDYGYEVTISKDLIETMSLQHIKDPPWEEK